MSENEVDQFHESLDQLLRLSLPIWRRQIDTVNNQLVTSVSSLTERFMSVAYLVGQFKALEGQGKGWTPPEGSDLPANIGEVLGGDVEHIINGFQFQDRVTQILGHVSQELDELGLTIGNALNDLRKGKIPPPLDVEAWNQAMLKNYTTPEEHQSHHGEEAGGGKQDGDDVELF